MAAINALLLVASAEVTVTVSTGVPESAHPTVAEAQQRVAGAEGGRRQGGVVLDIGEGVHPPFAVGAADSGLHRAARTVHAAGAPRRASRAAWKSRRPSSRAPRRTRRC